MKRRSDWNYYSYRYGEGQEATVHFDVQAALVAPSSHVHCVRVVVPDGTGTFETALMELLAEVDGLLVGIMHYGGQTEFVLQVEHHHAVVPHEGSLIERGAALQHCPGWDYFDDRVCPTDLDWRRITDREAIDRLVRSGVSPDEPMEL